MIRTLHNLTRAGFTLALSLIYAIVCAGQVLGFFKIYKLAIVLPFTLLVFLLVFYLYWRLSTHFFAKFLDPAEKKVKWVDIAFGTAGLALLIVCILLPVIRWPFTPIYDTLSWDVGLYHLPKAIEMVKTGSAWDLSISYGEYPFGYESILAFPALITHGRFGFGPAHGLTNLFFVLSFWLLFRRLSGLPGGITLFLTSGLMLSGYFPQIAPNPWWFYNSLLNTIGKNDLFVGASVLAVILHAPIGTRDGHKYGCLCGMALASMVAVSVKPNAALIVIPLWIVVLITQVLRGEFPRNILNWGGYALAVLPGSLWAVRNLASQGELFSTPVRQLQTLSIAANLTNPNLLNNVPRTLIMVIIVTVFAIVSSIFIRRIHWTIPFIAVLLLIGFSLTPASGFFPDVNRPAEIAWRFAAALMALIFIIPFVIFAPWINKIYSWVSRTRVVNLAAIALSIAASAWVIWTLKDFNSYHPENVIVLQDQFRESVGVDGYHSAYDYVQKNGGDSVVWVENGMPYYAYGQNFSNSVTRSQPARYLVIFQTAWNGGEPGYPDNLNDPAWLEKWKLVYEDQEGRVYLHQDGSPQT